jgi:hypothetical protein
MKKGPLKVWYLMVEEQFDHLQLGFLLIHGCHHQIYNLAVSSWVLEALARPYLQRRCATASKGATVRGDSSVGMQGKGLAWSLFSCSLWRLQRLSISSGYSIIELATPKLSIFLCIPRSALPMY